MRKSTNGTTNNGLMKKNNITVIVATSPLVSHPDTRIIDETLASIRNHLPTADIILQFDGVHESQKRLTDNYNHYKNKMLWRCLHEYTNVLPVVFETHQHQSGMLHQTIGDIKTPLLLYVEGDTPLTIDRQIDWQSCIDFIDEGQANTIRFHFEEIIPTEHESLMWGNPVKGFLRTNQWSQRPHLSSTLYYQELLKYFPTDSRTFIEDEWHGVVINDWLENGKHGWYKHRLWIYYKADSLGIKRSYTTDGREGEPKFGEGFRTNSDK